MTNATVNSAGRALADPSRSLATPIRPEPAAAGGRHPPGYFVLSLDTELAWGYYDDDDERERLFSPDGSRERCSIERVLALCDAYGIRATWAMVGHLFFTHCEDCEPCSVAAWRNDNRAIAKVYQPGSGNRFQRPHPLWYAPEVRDRLLAVRDRHELAFHGFTHRPFDQMDETAARGEIRSWLALASRYDLTPRSVVFPRNSVAHLDAFAEAGFACFRSPDPRTRWHLRRFGPGLKSLDDLLALSTPRTFGLNELRREGGLIRLPASAHLFDFPRTLECALDRAGLQRLRLRGILRSIMRAADTGSIVHLWAHPWEMRTEADDQKLRAVLAVAAEQVEKGRLRNVTMDELAGIACGSAPAARADGDLPRDVLASSV